MAKRRARLRNGTKASRYGSKASKSTPRRERRRSGWFWTPSSSSGQIERELHWTEREREIGQDGKELGREIDRN